MSPYHLESYLVIVFIGNCLYFGNYGNNLNQLVIVWFWASDKQHRKRDSVQAIWVFEKIATSPLPLKWHAFWETWWSYSNFGDCHHKFYNACDFVTINCPVSHQGKYLGVQSSSEKQSLSARWVLIFSIAISETWRRTPPRVTKCAAHSRALVLVYFSSTLFFFFAAYCTHLLTVVKLDFLISILMPNIENTAFTATSGTMIYTTDHCY